MAQRKRLRKRFHDRHKFICAVDGFEYYSEDKAIRWDGVIVAKRNNNSRQPQDLIRAVKDDPSIRDAQPEPADRFDADWEIPTFALLDEFDNPIFDEDDNYIQVPPPGATLE